MLILVQHGLSNVLVASVLAVLVLIVTRLVRRPALAHALWLIVLVKLVTPPLVLIPLPWPMPTASAQEKQNVVPVAKGQASAVVVGPPAVRPAVGPVAVDKDDQPGSVQVKEQDNPTSLEPAAINVPEPLAGVPVPAAPVVEPPPAGQVPIEDSLVENLNWWTLAAGGLWLGGSFLWLALAGWRVWRFQRLLQHTRSAAVDLQQEGRQLAYLLGLRSCPEIRLIPGNLSPMLWSFLGPARLLVPESLLSRLDSTQRATLLLHELAHWVTPGSLGPAPGTAGTGSVLLVPAGVVGVPRIARGGRIML